MVIALPLWTREAGGHYHNHPSLGKEARVLMTTSISSFGQEEKPVMVSPSSLLAKKEFEKFNNFRKCQDLHTFLAV